MDYHYLYSFLVVLSHSIIAVLLLLYLFRPISSDQEQGDKTRPKRGCKSNPETKKKTGFVSKTLLDSNNQKQKKLTALQEISADQGDKTRVKRGCKSNTETKRKTGFVSKIQLVDDRSKLEEKRLIALQEIYELREMVVGEGKSCELSDSEEKIVSAESCNPPKCEIVDSTEKNTSDELGNNAVSSVVCQCQESLIDQRLISVNYGEIEIDLAKEVGLDKVESLCSEVTEEVDCIKEELFDEDDDWEGIERTELETRFGSAVAYVGSRGNANKKSKLRSDLKLELYGLHKIAIEGPCHTPQPMAFKFSARAKWNAWLKMGKMCPEVAMEQYMNLVTTIFPEWMKGDSREVDDQDIADERNPEEVIDHTQGLDAGPNSSKPERWSFKLRK